MAAKTERRFENIDLLKSLLGDSKKETKVELSASTQKPPNYVQNPLQGHAGGGYNQNRLSGSSTTSLVPSIRSDVSSSSAPPPYQAYPPPEAGDRAHHRASTSDLPAVATNPPARIVAPRAHTMPSSAANTGLKALFQAPAALGGVQSTGGIAGY
ncbi:hypothetical protein SLS62_001833 [Diatrype stigma]|uniref:Uncharacterized protein n=1 Tax=Diatrype stigma TaxID=117547 RepID=A0AAN9V7Z3_9PEZI